MPKTKKAIRLQRFLKFIQPPPPGKLLDLSCGEGRLLGLIHEKWPELSLHGMDFSTEAIAIARADHPETAFQVALADSLPFPDNFFDVITCTMSLHHYSNPLGVVQEIHRVLKPNGIMYLMDVLPKNKVSQRLYNLKGCGDKYHFEKFYVIGEIIDLFARSGLSLVSKQLIKNFSRVEALQLTKNQ